MKNSPQSLSQVTLYGILAVFALITLLGGVSYLDLFVDMKHFFTGNLDLVSDGSTEPLHQIVLNGMLIIIIDVCFVIPLIFVSQKVNGQAKSFNYDGIKALIKHGPSGLFFTVLGEEVISRWLFLGVIAPLFDSNIAFYVCLLLGNSLFGLVHLFNYTNPEERSILRILPQFFGGLFLSYTFVRYGLFVTFLIHFAYDIVLLSSLKEQKLKRQDLQIALYYGVTFVISGFAMITAGLSVTDLKPWMDLSGDLSGLPGYSLIDYLILFVFIDSGLELLCSILVMDRMKSERKYLNFFLLFLSALITVLIIGLLNWIIGFFIEAMVVKTIIIVMVFQLLQRTSNGSMMARSWLTSLPTTFLITAAFLVLGIWHIMAMFIAFLLIGYLPLYWQVTKSEEMELSLLLVPQL